jgi:hypothetical protein
MMTEEQQTPAYRKAFFDLCKELYVEEYQRVEAINQRAVNLITLFSAIGGAIYVIASLICVNGYPQSLVIVGYVSLGVSLVSAIIGIIFLFLTIFPKKTRNMATLDKWNDWLEEREKYQHPTPTTIETDLYNYVAGQLANGQAARFQNNEKCFGFLKKAQIYLVVTLFALLVAAGSQLFICCPANEEEGTMHPIEASTPPQPLPPPPPPPPPPPEETIKTADDKKK